MGPENSKTIYNKLVIKCIEKIRELNVNWLVDEDNHLYEFHSFETHFIY